MTERSEKRKKASMEYRIWLKNTLDEYGITKDELSLELENRLTNVQRIKELKSYIEENNNKFPTKQEREIINSIIRDKSSYNGYSHQPMHYFRNILIDIKESLHMSQEQLGELIEMSQSQISRLISPQYGKEIDSLNLSAKEQCRILLKLRNKLCGRYGSTIIYKNYSLDFLFSVLLYDDTETVYEDEDIDGYSFNQNLYWLFEELDFKTQNLILNYPHAFFEFPYMIKEVAFETDTYFSELLSDFDKCMKMDLEMRNEYISNAIKTEPLLSKHPSMTEKHLYLSLYEMGLLCFGVTQRNSEKGTKKKKDLNCIEFNKLMNDWGLGYKEEAELRKKLEFCNEDWYIWRVLFIKHFNKIYVNDNYTK